MSTGYQQDLPDGSQIPFQDNVFWLIEENYFAKDALYFANSLVEQMKQQLQRTKDNNEMRKKVASAREQPSTVALIVLSTFSELETSDESS